MNLKERHHRATDAPTSAIAWSQARYWSNRLGDPGASICALSCTGATHRADAALLLGDAETLSVTRDRGRRYWRGGAGDAPEFTA
jgi:hypothetical protein